MEIIKLHPDLLEPKRGTAGAAGYDLFMPEAGSNFGHQAGLTGLGFAAKVPEGYVALILPRSSAGVKLGVRLGNTVGVIDSDYEGEWKVNVRGNASNVVTWKAGERLFQFVVVPVSTPELVFVDKFSTSSERGEGGFGSTDNVDIALTDTNGTVRVRASDIPVSALTITPTNAGYLPIRTPDTPTGFSYQRKPVFAMNLTERGWYDENAALSEDERRDPAVFLKLFKKWFEQ